MERETLRAVERMHSEGATYSEIARRLSIPPNTVRYNLLPECREKHSEWARRDYEKNGDAIRKRTAARYITHREEINAKIRADRKANPERYRLQERRKYLKHGEEIKARVRSYRTANANKKSEWEAKRRAAKAGAIVGITAERRSEITEIYRQARERKTVRCYLCGEAIPKGQRNVDHIIPLSKGGEHRPSNLAVCCGKCNRRKADKLPEEVGILI